jgi:hypothetical protein
MAVSVVPATTSASIPAVTVTVVEPPPGARVSRLQVRGDIVVGEGMALKNDVLMGRVIVNSLSAGTTPWFIMCKV